MGSGKCLDDSGSTNAGAGPYIADCDGSVDQKWRMAGGWWRPNGTTFQVHSGDAYTLLAGNGNANTALDTGGGSTNGSKMTLASAMDTNKANQVMFVATGSNTYKISFVNNPAKCIDHPMSWTDGQDMQVWDCNGGSNQNWTLSSAQNGSVQLKNQWSGKCLTNSSVTPGNVGVPVETWPCGDNNGSNPGWNQIWQLVTYN